MNKVVAFGDFVREHTAAVCTLAGLIILILGLLLYRMNMNGKKLAAALEEAKREKEYAYRRNLCNNALEESESGRADPDWEQADKTGNKSRFPSHGRIEVDHGGKNANTDR